MAVCFIQLWGYSLLFRGALWVSDGLGVLIGKWIGPTAWRDLPPYEECLDCLGPHFQRQFLSHGSLFRKDHPININSYQFYLIILY